MRQHEEDIKPKSLPLHDFLVRKTGVKLMIDETIVEKVIAHEKKGIRDAFRFSHEVEISGFGKFYISSPKLHKRIIRQERMVVALTKRATRGEDVTRNLGIAQSELQYYKSVLEGYEDRYRRNIGRGKKRTLLTEGAEGEDRQSSGGEDKGL